MRSDYGAIAAGFGALLDAPSAPSNRTASLESFTARWRAPVVRRLP